MPKYLFAFFLSIFFFINVSAQPATDTLVYYVKNDGNLAPTKSEADYILFIMPETRLDKQKLYPVLSFYPDGKRRMIATSSVRSTTIVLEGTQMMFFRNGKRSSVTSYKKGIPIGEQVTYYPNGQIYTRKDFQKNQTLLIECRDSTGLILAENGNGKWIELDETSTVITAQGSIKDGLMDGEWQTMDRTLTYNKGVVKNSELSLATFQKSLNASKADEFKVLADTLERFIINNLNENIKPEVFGKQMYIEFFAARDTTLNTFSVIRSPSEKVAEELTRAIKLSLPVKLAYKIMLTKPKAFIVPIYFSPNKLTLSSTKNELIDTPNSSKNLILNTMSIPEFPGGTNAFGNFLAKTIKYPRFERDNKIMGKVFTAFVVDYNGAIVDLHVTATSSIGLAEEALRVMRQSPNWKPASINGKPVRVQYTVPINFTLGEEH